MILKYSKVPLMYFVSKANHWSIQFENKKKVHHKSFLSKITENVFGIFLEDATAKLNQNYIYINNIFYGFYGWPATFLRRMRCINKLAVFFHASLASGILQISGRVSQMYPLGQQYVPLLQHTTCIETKYITEIELTTKSTLIYMSLCQCIGCTKIQIKWKWKNWYKR